MSADTRGTILVTGANGGLGSAIASLVASTPEYSAYHGLYTVRDTEHSEALTSVLGTHTTHPHEVVALDLTKLDEVRRVAASINARVASGDIPPIRALLLVAGFLDFGKQTWTADGWDTVFAANYLGHWLLTLLLLQSMDKETGRIVVTGSYAHDPRDPRNSRTGAFDEAKYQTFLSDADSFHTIARGEWSSAAEDAGFRGGYRRYAAAKLLHIMMQHELQARLSAHATLGNISVLGVDPGAMRTGLQRLAPWAIRVLAFQIIYPFLLWMNPDKAFLRPVSAAAADMLQAAFGVVEGGCKDRYFNGVEPYETSEESRDPIKRRLVWDETAKLTGLREDETILFK